MGSVRATSRSYYTLQEPLRVRYTLRVFYTSLSALRAISGRLHYPKLGVFYETLASFWLFLTRSLQKPRLLLEEKDVPAVALSSCVLRALGLSPSRTTLARSEGHCKERPSPFSDKVVFMPPQIYLKKNGLKYMFLPGSLTKSAVTVLVANSVPFSVAAVTPSKMSKFLSQTRFFTKGSSFAKLTGCTQGAEKPVLELSNLSKPIVEFLADPL